jgi:DNA-binding LacI/PurR family transcriptional regulator
MPAAAEGPAGIIQPMNDAPKPAPAPTLSDVAELAGVSRAIASRALSAEPRPVSADKREKVLRAAETLGYRPNSLARGLANNTVNLVAILVNHIHDLSDLDLFDLLLAEIQAIGKQVIFIRVGAGEHAESFLRDGVAYHVDAALVFSDFADAATVRRMFRNNAVLMLNGHHDTGAPSVTMDEDHGIGEAVADAAGKGVRTALLLTGRTMSLVEQARIASYRAALVRHGVNLLGELAGDYSYASGRALAGRIDVEATGAVFCTSDAMAMGVLDAHRAHFPDHRPARFRLYGFDNVSLTQFDAYPISSIGADKRAYVAQIVRILNQEGPLAQNSEHVLVPTRFVPRLTG